MWVCLIFCPTVPYILYIFATNLILLTKIPFVQMPFSRVCTDAGENWVREIESVSFVTQKKQNTVFITKSNFLSKIYCSMLFFSLCYKMMPAQLFGFHFSQNKVKARENKYIFSSKVTIQPIILSLRVTSWLKFNTTK